MCIRDREYGDMLLLTGDNGNVGVAVTPDGDIVSVFKNPESSAKGAVSSIPVSYTHLDVYKRQDIFCGMGLLNWSRHQLKRDV